MRSEAATHLEPIEAAYGRRMCIAIATRLICRAMSVAPAVSLPLRAQVLLNVIKADSVQVNPADLLYG